MPENSEQPKPSEKEIDPKIQDLREKSEHIEGLKSISEALASGEINESIAKELLSGGIISYSRWGNWTDYLEKVSSLFPTLCQDVLSSPDIQQLGKTQFIEMMGHDDWTFEPRRYYPDIVKKKAEKYKKLWGDFSFSDEDIREIVKSSIARQLSEKAGSFYGSSDGPSIAKIMLKQFPLDDSSITEAAKEGLIRRIKTSREKIIMSTATKYGKTLLEY